MTRSNAPYLAYVQILAGALLLSTGATVIKSVNFGVLELAGWRAAVIALFLLVAVRPPRVCWDRKLVPAALAHGITTLLFMWGNKLTAAATAIFLQYTAPLYLLLLGPWLLKEPFQRRDLGIVGLIAVASYMVLSYGLFGVFANIALAINMTLLIALMSTIGATLTLPGIAGIVLTTGIAVDSNVLIFERIREELRDGKSPVRAIELGFERAFSAILDSNITGLITALIMFVIGSGAVRGFAVTTGIGIFTSMFTTILVTRLIVTSYINWKQPKELVV